MDYIVIILGLGLFITVLLSPLRPLIRRTIEIVIVVGVILYFRTPIERWAFELAEVPVSSVTSGNEFSTRGIFFLKRRLALAGTELPAEFDARKRATSALEERILDRNVSIEMASNDRRAPEPWPVRVLVDSVSINELMVRDGYLRGTDALAGSGSEVGAVMREPTPDEATGPTEDPSGAGEQVEPEPAKSTDRPMAVRILIWVLLGFVGATGLGMLLNKRLFGWVPLLGVAGAAVWHIIQSWREDVSNIPPVIALILIVLMSGNAARANRFVQKE